MNPPIIVIGDAMLDHNILGHASRLSPEAPVPVVRRQREEWRLGGAGNVLTNLAALNAPAILFSVSGADEAATQMAKALPPAMPPYSHLIVADESRPTTVKTRVIAQRQQLLRVDHESTEPIDLSIVKKLLDALARAIPGAAAVAISDYRKGMLTPALLKEIFALCSAHNLPCLVDPKGSDAGFYYKCDLLKPNRHELHTLTGMPVATLAQVEAAARHLQHITDCNRVVVTLSEEGMLCVDAEGVNHLPTFASEVFDVTGAGDTVLASLVFALTQGQPLQEACKFANAAASVSVTHLGCYSPRLSQIEQVLHGHHTA